jgi:hypothetical protein
MNLEVKGGAEFFRPEGTIFFWAQEGKGGVDIPYLAGPLKQSGKPGKFFYSILHFFL